MASAAHASTAANTQIVNTARVNYNDAGGVAQPFEEASATVTVTLVPGTPTITSPKPITSSICVPNRKAIWGTSRGT